MLPVQMPFSSFTVGQVFFAVVHEHARPPLDFFEKAMAENEEERPVLEGYVGLMKRCWADSVAERPRFPGIYAELGSFKAQLAMRSRASGMSNTPATPSSQGQPRPKTALASGRGSGGRGPPDVASPFGRTALPPLSAVGSPRSSAAVAATATAAPPEPIRRLSSDTLPSQRPPMPRASSAPLRLSQTDLTKQDSAERHDQRSTLRSN
jgi:hypothetical protein